MTQPGMTACSPQREPTVAVLGGGQLGRMLALAGYPLGLRFRFIEASEDCPAGQVAPVIVGDYEDPAALRALASGVAVATYEFENVPVGAAMQLGERLPVWPPVRALEVAQDRLNEKRTFRELAIPTTAFESVASFEDLPRAIEQIGMPAVLKTRRFGYDGKGQFLIRSEQDIPQAWQALGGRPLILEEFVPFQRELAMLAVRGPNGQEAFYDLTQTHHARGILDYALAPAPNMSPELQSQAVEYARRLLEHLGYVGVLALELFDCGNGRLLASEIAPRVHNSGHWTMDGATTSQFENHLRAVMGWPLGDPSGHGFNAMMNLVGRVPPLEALCEFPWAKIHLYGKQPRPGRKLGHVNLCAGSEAERTERLGRLLQIIQNDLG